MYLQNCNLHIPSVYFPPPAVSQDAGENYNYMHPVEAAESVHKTWAQKCHKARLKDIVKMQTVEELNQLCLACLNVMSRSHFVFMH